MRSIALWACLLATAWLAAGAVPQKVFAKLPDGGTQVFVHRVVVEGNALLDAREVNRRLYIQQGFDMDRATIDLFARELEGLYEARGYFLVQVRAVGVRNGVLKLAVEDDREFEIGRAWAEIKVNRLVLQHPKLKVSDAERKAAVRQLAEAYLARRQKEMEERRRYLAEQQRKVEEKRARERRTKLERMRQRVQERLGKARSQP